MRLAVASFATVPRLARPGKALSAKLTITLRGSGTRVRSGEVACPAQAGGKSIAPLTAGFRSGVAQCTWTIPARARGKTVAGSVRVGHKGVRISRSFRLKVARS